MICDYIVQVESSDLISYGLIPEFIGRFPVLVSLSALNEEQLVQVIVVFSVITSFTALFCKLLHNFLFMIVWMMDFG